jgi:hypothetical protein
MLLTILAIRVWADLTKAPLMLATGLCILSWSF